MPRYPQHGDDRSLVQAAAMFFTARFAARLAAAVFACALAAPAIHAATPLPTVPALDLDRYLGVWHEIARYPNRFQE